MARIHAKHGYSASMVKDSLNTATGDRLSTMHIRLPWYITPELLRHRQFSFSSRSTRAVPVNLLLKMATEDTCLPVSWGKNQRGMQAGDEFDEDTTLALNKHVVSMAGFVANTVRVFEQTGVHKQNANKYLIPFLWCDILVSSTRWANCLALRTHTDAAPEMQVIAGLMADCLIDSRPRNLLPGEWHTPYIDDLKEAERETGWEVSWADHRLLYCSAARIARVSLINFEDGKADWNKDLVLGEKLKNSRPVHASPFEHVAQAREFGETKSGNFDAGFAQLRSMLPMQTTEDFVWKGVSIK